MRRASKKFCIPLAILALDLTPAPDHACTSFYLYLSFTILWTKTTFSTVLRTFASIYSVSKDYDRNLCKTSFALSLPVFLYSPPPPAVKALRIFLVSLISYVLPVFLSATFILIPKTKLMYHFFFSIFLIVWWRSKIYHVLIIWWLSALNISQSRTCFL